MEVGSSPKKVTSQRIIKYRKSSWKLREFEIWSGEMICKAVALQMKDSLFVWLGGREPLLSEVSLALPYTKTAAVTTLLGGEQGTGALARRLSVAFARPVYVCSGQLFDRFTAPLVESGIVSEIKSE